MPGNDLSTSRRLDPVCVLGAGYVGLVTAACLAESGVEVRLLEVDEHKLRTLRSGRSPIHEPGLDQLLARVIGRTLHVMHDVAEAVPGAQAVIIAVGTPPLPDGNADLSQVRRAVVSIAAHADPGTVIVVKSTVPPGTTRSMLSLARRRSVALPLVMCPEFLREGNALHDFRHPARVVAGGDNEEACRRVAALFAPSTTETIVTDSTSAEMIKYGANAFLALKISFINELAHLCELAGADVTTVADGVGSDGRIGRAFLDAGLGFGGSCFPKDIRALDETASYHGHSFWLLKAAIEVNTQQRRRFVAKISSALRGKVAGRRIAILGLAFKPGTDDMRQAASIDIVRHLTDMGARLAATDPVALHRAEALLPDDVEFHTDPYECVRSADVVVLVTEWPEYRSLDFARVRNLVKGPVIVDGRNSLDGKALAALGFTYHSIGRASLRPAREGERKVTGKAARIGAEVA